MKLKLKHIFPIIIISLLSCNVRYKEPKKKGDKYYFGSKKTIYVLCLCQVCAKYVSSNHNKLS